MLLPVLVSVLLLVVLVLVVVLCVVVEAGTWIMTPPLLPGKRILTEPILRSEVKRDILNFLPALKKASSLIDMRSTVAKPSFAERASLWVSAALDDEYVCCMFKICAAICAEVVASSEGAIEAPRRNGVRARAVYSPR